MSTLPSRPMYMQRKWRLNETTSRNVQKLKRTFWLSPSLGATLLIMLAAILLSACCPPVVIREPAPKLPAPDSSLMRPPLNLDLVPPEMLPSKSAKSASTTR